MPVFSDPVVILEDVRLLKVSLSSHDLEVAIRVENPNPLGITPRELPFNFICSPGHTDQQLASGNTGRVKIARVGSTVLRIPVTSQNDALLRALATFAPPTSRGKVSRNEFPGHSVLLQSGILRCAGLWQQTET